MLHRDEPSSGTQRRWSKWLQGSAVAALVVFGASSASAQAAPQPDKPVSPQDADKPSSEIVVTGSRIQRPNETQATPITTVSSAAIANRGTVNIAEALATVPAVAASRFSASGAPRDQFLAGLYTIDLRGLGNYRTLVLVDGRRYVSSLQGGSAVDVSTIPTDLIERVDVTTGGASAVYGSDAVAGVVNFVLKKNFQGLQLRAQGGVSQRGDGAQQKFGVVAGTNFAGGRGNITVDLSYDQTKEIDAVDRSFSADGVLISNPQRPDLAIFGPGSYTSAQTAQGVFGLNGTTIAGSTIRRTVLPDGTVATVNAARDGINPNKFVIMSLPMKRYLANLRGHFDITDDLSVFAEGTYSRNDTVQQLDQTYVATGRMNIGGPTGLPITIPVSNPFIPAGFRALIPAGQTAIPVARDLPEFGGRRVDYTRQLYRFVGGVDAKLPFLGDSWKANAYYEYGRASLDETMLNGYNTVRMQNALNVVPNGSGGYMCADSAARATGCIPVNLFTGNPLTAAERAYLYQNARIHSYNEQQVASGSITGNLFRLPGGPVGFAAGAEYRKEKSSYQPDDNLRNGTSSLQFSQPTVGAFDVKEVYAELTAPLLADLPFIRRLEAEGAFRYADYSSTGSVTAWKIGGNYEPVKGVRLRGIYSKDIRAPQILDLFSGALLNRANVIDPCARGGNAATAAYCSSQPGVNAGFNPPSPTPVQQITVGNSNLKPEIARTLTAGIVLQPPFIRGLTLSADYFRIKIKHAITTLDTQTVINQCAASNDPLYCNTIIRDPSTGVIITNNTVPLNAANQLLKGIDAELNYHTSLDNIANGKLGDSINLTIDYTHLIRYQQNPYAGALPIELKGQPYYPSNKGSGNLTYSNGGLELSFTERYIGKVYRVVGAHFAGNAVPAYWYTDAQVRYTINKAYSFYLGVNNLTDKKPPLFPTPYIGTSTGTNTASAVYDIIGRYLYAGVNLKF